MENRVGIKRFGPVTFYVKDAAAEAERLSHLLAMDIAYVPAGRDPVFGVQANDVLFILDGSPRCAAMAERYGNHVAEIGIRVADSRAALDACARVTNEPMRLCEKTGVGYLHVPHDGEVYLRFLEDGQCPYLGMVENPTPRVQERYSFSRIDHIVFNTQRIAPVVAWMHDVLGMDEVNEFTVRVETEEFTASLYSEVMGIYGSEAPVLFPLNEPLAGDDHSQIPAQLREVGRSHAQHIAVATDNIIDCVANLRAHGVVFLDFKSAGQAECYYNDVPKRLGFITPKEAMATLQAQGILVDKCGEGYLLQLFSKRLFPEHSVPFVEIIQRASDVIGCFGDGNFAALAESLERSMRTEHKERRPPGRHKEPEAE